MGDAFKKVKSGDTLRIPAATFNAFIDAAQAHRNRTIGNTGTAPVTNALPSGQVLVRNDSGSDLWQFSVLGIDGVAISPDDNGQEFVSHIVLSGVVPKVDDETDHRGRFCVLAEPLKAGAIGRAFVDHVCQVQVYPGWVDWPEIRFVHHADVKDGETGRLEMTPDGSAEVLWRKDGVGAQWAVVRLGTWHGPRIHFCEITADHEDGTYDVKDIDDNNWTAEGLSIFEAPNNDYFRGAGVGRSVRVVQRPNGLWYLCVGHDRVEEEEA